MTEKTAKKMRECFFLECLRAVYESFPQGEIIPFESPDFLVVQNDAFRIGIELTDYVRGQGPSGSDFRKKEIFHREIAEKSQEIFDGRNDRPIYVLFNMSRNLDYQKSSIDSYAEKLVSFIEDQLTINDNDTIHFTYIELMQSPIQNIVSGISIITKYSGKSSLFGAVESGFIGIRKTEIQEIIDSKKLRIQKYREKCNKIWLVILADGSRITSSINSQGLDDDVCSGYKYDFDKVLFYDYYNNAVTDIRK